MIKLINESEDTTNSVAILENFRNVLESAYDNYELINESHDYVGICLNEMDNGSMELINESMDLDSEYNISINESILTEGTNVSVGTIVKEKKGTGLSVTINGKEYRYVSPTKSTEELAKSFNGMMKHANAGYKALNWLKKNAICYYGSKNDSEEGKQLVGI